jgi:hypothetical protein
VLVEFKVGPWHDAAEVIAHQLTHGDELDRQFDWKPAIERRVRFEMIRVLVGLGPLLSQNGAAALAACLKDSSTFTLGLDAEPVLRTLLNLKRSDLLSTALGVLAKTPEFWKDGSGGRHLLRTLGLPDSTEAISAWLSHERGRAL